MEDRSERTRLVIGDDGVEALGKSRVLVFGAGGVGSYTLEALVRTGIGTVGACDFDTVAATNLNRQLFALETTLGRKKVDVFRERAAEIDPSVRTVVFDQRLTLENIGDFRLNEWDYVVDAIDDVPAKVALAEACASLGVPLIMSMGTGNKFDPSRLMVADIAKTHTCPLAKAVRKELRSRGIDHVKCVFSDELPVRTGPGPIGTLAFVPASAGLLIASTVVRELLGR